MCRFVSRKSGIKKEKSHNFLPTDWVLNLPAFHQDQDLNRFKHVTSAVPVKDIVQNKDPPAVPVKQILF